MRMRMGAAARGNRRLPSGMALLRIAFMHQKHRLRKPGMHFVL